MRSLYFVFFDFLAAAPLLAVLAGFRAASGAVFGGLPAATSAAAFANDLAKFGFDLVTVVETVFFTLGSGFCTAILVAFMAGSHKSQKSLNGPRFVSRFSGARCRKPGCNATDE